MANNTMPPDDEIIEAGPGSSNSSDPYDIAGETFSVDSSITAYRVENGRRYHAYRDGAYWQPNDDKQNEVLDILHHKWLKMYDDKLHLAPLEKEIERAIDIGCGTGIWTIDFADEYPSTAVLGIDLSPIQPNLVPPNCRFEVDDMRDEWIYPPNYFDFVHIRNLLGSISDWTGLYKQALTHLKPGAWIEQSEMGIDFKTDDGTIPPGSTLDIWPNHFREAARITGQQFDVSHTMKNDIVAAGFVNVHERIFKVPFGNWPANRKLREVGMWTALSFDLGLEGYVLGPLTRALDWNANEVQVWIAQVRAAIHDRSVHSYHEIRTVYAQKPFVSADSI